MELAREHRHGQLCWLCGKEVGHREHYPSLPTRLPACEDGCQGLQSVVIVVEKKRALRGAKEPLPHVALEEQSCDGGDLLGSRLVASRLESIDPEGLWRSKDGFDRTNEVYTIQRLYTH